MPARGKPGRRQAPARGDAPVMAASDSIADSGSDSAPEEQFRQPGGGSRPSADDRALRRMQAAVPSDDEVSDGHESDESADDDSQGGAGSSGDDDGSNSDASSDPGSDDNHADMPFEELAARRASGDSAGPGGGGGASGPPGRKRGKGKAALAHRENKNRPTEASSKRPISKLRDVLQAPKQGPKDPRFEDLSSAYNPARFRKQYAFLYEEALPKERSGLKAAMKKVKSAERREELSTEAARVEAQLREDAAQQKRRKFESNLKAKERAAVRAGKKPFYLKKADKRRAELVAKYEELKKGGGLDRYMARRRRKNAAKDHRYVPRVGGRSGD